MTDKLKQQLEKILYKKNVLFVGIGNALKSDDAIGIYVVENIKQRANIKTLVVESGIEKFIGKINSISSDVLILADCTDLNKSQASILLPIEKIQDNTVNSHTISLKRISEFFKMETYLLGIQPENVGFGEKISEKVKKEADELVNFINKKNGFQT